MCFFFFQAEAGIRDLYVTEVPTGSAPFIGGNPVPASHTLPNSFYLGSRPAFFTTPFGTVPWPPVHVETNGGTGPGGFSDDTAAALCYKNTAVDSANFPGTAILKFDASACYTST